MSTKDSFRISEYLIELFIFECTFCISYNNLWRPTGQVGLGVGSWPTNQATEGSNPKGTRLYFVILLKNVEKKNLTLI